MEHFALGVAPTGAVVDGIAWRDTPAYVEAKVAIEKAWLPIYVITVDERTGAAVTCWDHQFDAILENLSKPQIESVLRRIHPTWFQCVDNATRERYGDGALLEMLDPDVMNRKWMIGVLFSHLAEDTDSAAAKAMEKVMGISLAVFNELQNKPSKFDYIRVAAAGAAQGGSQGMAIAQKIYSAARWIPNFEP